MPTTSNFGWTTPADTDLVKNGALAIRTLGNGIDTSMAELKGGTTGQILSKTSNTDMDFTWINNDQGDITEVNVTSPITGGGTSGAVTISIQDGTTTQKGAVQLENSTSSTSTTTAAVPASVKSAYDLANGAIPKSLVDAAGDLIYATANDTVARLALGTAGQVLKVNSGATAPEWGTAAAGFSSFTDYTPTFTNFTLGNGTVTTQYATSGSLVWYQGRITIGSTSSFSGSLRISLPYQITTTFTDGFYYPMLSVGSGWDSSASTVKVATVRSATSSTLSLTSLDTNTAWTTTQPWTWASDDRINFQVIYRSSEL